MLRWAAIRSSSTAKKLLPPPPPAAPLASACKSGPAASLGPPAACCASAAPCACACLPALRPCEAGCTLSSAGCRAGRAVGAGNGAPQPPSPPAGCTAACEVGPPAGACCWPDRCARCGGHMSCAAGLGAGRHRRPPLGAAWPEAASGAASGSSTLGLLCMGGRLRRRTEGRSSSSPSSSCSAPCCCGCCWGGCTTWFCVPPPLGHAGAAGAAAAGPRTVACCCWRPGGECCVTDWSVRCRRVFTSCARLSRASAPPPYRRLAAWPGEPPCATWQRAGPVSRPTSCSQQAVERHPPGTHLGAWWAGGQRGPPAARLDCAGGKAAGGCALLRPAGGRRKQGRSVSTWLEKVQVRLQRQQARPDCRSLAPAYLLLRVFLWASSRRIVHHLQRAIIVVERVGHAQRSFVGVAVPHAGAAPAPGVQGRLQWAQRNEAGPRRLQRQRGA